MEVGECEFSSYKYQQDTFRGLDEILALTC